MRTTILGLATVITLVELSKWIFELAGQPNLTPSDDDFPRTVWQLQSENLPLPNEVYNIFQRGVDHHLKREFSQARQCYGQIYQTLDLSGNSFDLAQESTTFRFNLNLLDLQEKKNLGQR